MTSEHETDRDPVARTKRAFAYKLFFQQGVLPFNASLNDLDAALTRLETVRDTAKRLPFANPAPGRRAPPRSGRGRRG